MENLQDNLDFFDEDVSDLQTKLQGELDDVLHRRLQEHDKITRVTAVMKTIIQNTEEKLVAQSQHLFTEFENNLKKSIETAKQMKREISSIRSQADDALTSGSRDQFTEENLKMKYDTLQGRFAALQKALVVPVFKQVDDDLAVLKEMEIGVFERTEELGVGSSTAQTISFPTQRENDVNPCFPTGLLWVNGMFIISDKGNKKLKFFSESGEFLSEILFANASPYGVCHLKENSFAVTLPKIKQIYFVKIEYSKSSVISCFYTFTGYAGLCNGLNQDSLVATVASNTPGESHVDIIGFRGEVFISFKNDPQLGVPLFKFPRYVVASHGVLIISDWRKDCVIFLHASTGSVLKEYRGSREHPLVNPYDVSIDNVGNVYVMNGKDDLIHVVDLQCNLIEVIKAASELMSPRLIAYDSSSGRLAVTYGAGDIKSYHHRVRPTEPEQPATPPAQSPSFLLPPKQDEHLRCPSPGF